MTVKIKRLLGPCENLCYTQDFSSPKQVVSLVLESDLQELEAQASHAEAIAEICKINSLASDGWEMIEAAFRQEQADEIS